MRPARTALLVLAAAGAAASSPAQTVREKVSVEVITVRLTARGPFGKRVEDLKASDLDLKVDGRPVGIETFSGPEPAPASAAPSPTPSKEGPSATTVPSTATARSSNDVLPLRTMIFVDEVETQPFDRKDVCAELQRYLLAPGAAHREYRVARYDGTLHMETAWTRDTRAIAAVLDRIGRNGPIDRLPGPGTLAAAAGGDSYSSASWVLLHREVVAEALLEVLAAFPSTPGKDRILVVTGGTAMLRRGDLAFDMFAGSVGLVRDPLANDPNFQEKSIAANRERENQRATFEMWSRAVNPRGNELDMNDVVAKALERDVEVVPVYAEALDRGDFDLSGGPNQPLDDPLQTGIMVPTAGDGRLSPHVAAAAAMIGLANETGAEAIPVGREASSRLAQIEGRATYELTFRDTAADHDYHRITLACHRLGVKVEYRRGYRIPLEEERRLDSVVAGLRDADRLSNPMKVRVRQKPSTDSKQRPSTALEISYRPPLETGAPEERPVEVIAVGEDRDGNRTEPVEWKGTAGREEDGDLFEASVLLRVPPTYSWSIAVRDQPTGLTSYVFVPAPPRP